MLTRYLESAETTLKTVLADDKTGLFWSAALVKFLSTLKQGGTIYIAGNGGSAADAQHFAAELVGRFIMERRGYPAIALTTDTSAITAIGNDYGFDAIFKRQLEALATPNDCFVGITTSGNSKNITAALEYTKQRGIPSVVMTGRDGGVAKDLADITIIVPSEITSHIQEIHLMMYHAWCKELEQLLHGTH